VIKDRVVQMAMKIVIEPIFEADFQNNSYGFRPKRNAHQAVEDVKDHLFKGQTEVIDADISKYFDTIPHDKLMQILKLIKM
jgi:retron-type reverse transcriptase